MTIYAFVPDLMDKSRFKPVAGEKVFVKRAEDLKQAGAQDTAVADISRPGAFEAVAQLEGPRRVAFVSHIDDQAIAKAKAEGVEVFPRSRFFSRIVEILA